MIKKIGFICCSLLSMNAVANPEVTSREYKLMLDASVFNYSNEASMVDQYFKALKTTIEKAIDRDVDSGYTLSKERFVVFYDTPGSCQLRENGYSFRERIKVNGDSSVSFKFRSPDRYITGFEDVASSVADAESKFELDVGLNSESQFTSVYSASTKYDNDQLIQTMADVNNAFPGFKSRYDFSDSTVIAPVSGLKVYERVYRGMEIDLGRFDAEVSLTLWYPETPSSNDKTLVVEASFDYEDTNAVYSRKVVNRAKEAFYAMQEMDTWIDPESVTKTRFVYDYNPEFCQP